MNLKQLLSFNKREIILPPRCSYCGKFISYKDIEEGIATYKMIFPDSALSLEEFEGCCKKCRLKFKK